MAPPSPSASAPVLAVQRRLGQRPATGQAPPPQSTEPNEPPPTTDYRNSTISALVSGPESAGIRIIVHDPSVVPDPVTGVTIAPGTAAHVTFSRQRRSRQPPPYGECLRAWSSSAEAGDVAPQAEATYNRARCEDGCLYRRITSLCGCFLLPYPSDTMTADEFATLEATIPLCSVDDASCMDSTRDAYLRGQLGCTESCPIRCTEDSYDMKVSTQMWPSVASYDTMLDMARNVKKSMDVDQDYVGRNMLTIKVYPPSLEYMLVSTDVGYEIGDLMSDMGGQSGLWAGISLMSTLEILEFLALQVVVIMGCTSILQCRKRQRPEDRRAVYDASAGSDGIMHDDSHQNPA